MLAHESSDRNRSIANRMDSICTSIELEQGWKKIAHFINFHSCTTLLQLLTQTSLKRGLREGYTENDCGCVIRCLHYEIVHDKKIKKACKTENQPTLSTVRRKIQ